MRMCDPNDRCEATPSLFQSSVSLTVSSIPFRQTNLTNRDNRDAVC